MPRDLSGSSWHIAGHLDLEERLTNTKQFAVIYRTGGTENYRWHRVLATFTRDEAATKAEDLARMGYPALVHNAARLDAIGLPDTFTARDEGGWHV
jgi:hypothetical protein